MPKICFVTKTFPYDYENELLHSYELNEWLVVPSVGDIVDFERDSYYKKWKREQFGTKFRIVSKEISFSRGEQFRDDCIITLKVDPVFDI
jgi:hypothetical protein